jgi:uncharacterized protein
MITTLFKVEHSPIAGVGVFALQDIPEGILVHRMEGELSTLDEMIARVHTGDEAASDPFQIEDDLFLDLEETSRSFNHSCNPNVYVRGKNELVALRPIPKGEEITFDYATTMRYDAEKILASGHELWTCTCLCGAANCRGIIHEFKTLPQEIQEYYVGHRYLPDFMLAHYV